jgi:hypothetical protein
MMYLIHLYQFVIQFCTFYKMMRTAKYLNYTNVITFKIFSIEQEVPEQSMYRLHSKFAYFRGIFQKF